jgi:hypothetical protein
LQIWTCADSKSTSEKCNNKKHKSGRKKEEDGEARHARSAMAESYVQRAKNEGFATKAKL